MSKINNKVLIIVLVVLAGAYFGNKYFGDKGERNFKDVLVNIDTASVDKIILTPPPAKGAEILIIKDATGNFTVTREGLTDEGDVGMIRSMLAAHVEMKPERLVSNSQDKWAEYQVTDSAGIDVKMYSGDKLLSNILVGKFDFQQASRTMNTMVRIEGEDQVYAVDGFLSSVFNVEFNSLRDKTFIRADKNQVSSVVTAYPADSSFALNLVNGKWLVDNQPGDSVAVAKYVGGLAFLNLREFVDDFDPSQSDLLYKLTIAGDSINIITVDCYKRSEDYVLHSNLNENSYFTPGTNNIFEKLFPPKEKFYLKPE